MITGGKYRNAVPVATLVVIGLFILTIGIRFAYTFMDEVYFAEPVINLLRGDHYASFAWYVTTSVQTHVSTAPAYSFLLYLWLGIWGISQYPVRSLAVAFALAGVTMLWRACVRLGWIKSGLAGALIISVILLDYGVAFSYSCGRPDSLAFLLLATLFYLASLHQRALALWLTGLVGVVMPFVQWSVVIYTFCLAGALLLLFRKNVLKPILAVGAGIILGLIAERLIYTKLGLWETWVHTIQGEGSPNLFIRILNRLTQNPLRNHSNTIPKDFTSWILLAGLGFEFCRSRLFRDPPAIRLCNAGAIIAVAVGVGMYVVGKFPTYYGWMLCAPLAVLFAIYCDQVGSQHPRLLAGATVIAAAACALGLPLQLCAALHDWEDRKAEPVTTWLQANISKDDVVYCDYPFYYATKFQAKRVYTGLYIEPMTPEEARQVTLVILGPRNPYNAGAKIDLSHAQEIGRWTPRHSGLFGNSLEYGFLSSPNYECVVYKVRAP